MVVKVILMCSCISSLVFSAATVNGQKTEISGRQSKEVSFFPTEDEPDHRYDFSSVNYVDPKNLYQVSTSISVTDSDTPTYPPLGESRKGIVFDESPLGVSTFQSDLSSDYNRRQNQYEVDSSGGFQPSYSDPGSSAVNSDYSNPFYQNYATTESNYPEYQSPPSQYTGTKYSGSQYSGQSNKYQSSNYPTGSQQYPTGSQQYPGSQFPSSSQYPSSSKYSPSRYPSSPGRYPSKYPGRYPSNPYYYQGSASTSYPNYYPPNRYASPGQSSYYNPQTGSYYQGQYAKLTAAQQHASLYTPNKQSPYPYYQPNYAQQFGNYRPGNYRPNQNSNPNQGGLTGIISNIQNNIQNGQFGAIGGRFGKAIEDIAANDDLLCVPKLLCQMIGNPRRQSQLPAFLNSPAITTLIAALPSTSPMMIFGRAALLGLAGGEGYCDSAYPRCPRNEDDLLFYLNNHRGGFFRFFNGGAGGLGDENQLQNLQSFQQNQQNYGSNTDQGLNFLALQALANAINQGGAINLGGGNRPSQSYQDENQGGFLSSLMPNALSSLLSGLGGGGATTQRPTSNYQSQSSGGGLFDSFNQASLQSLVGNLLSGAVTNRYTRKISKRSIDDDVPKIESRIVNLKPSEIEAEEEIVPRIVNQRPVIEAEPGYVNRQSKVILVDSDNRYQNQIQEQLKYIADHVRTVDNSEFVIPNTPRDRVIKTNQGNLKLSFPAGIDEQNYQPQYQVVVQRPEPQPQTVHVVNARDEEQELIIQNLRQQLYRQQTLLQELQEQQIRLQEQQENKKKKKPQNIQQQTVRYQINDKEEFLSPTDVAKRLQMLFENGNNLKLDQNIFSDPQALQNLVTTLRLARILNGSNQPYTQNSVNRYSSTTSNQGYTPNQYQNYNSNQYNRYTTTRAPNYSQYYTNTNRYSANYNGNNYNEDRSHIAYITDSKGNIAYTLNEKTGEKKKYYGPQNRK